jgi:tetratricopeptide (TPR) repeat protein
MRASTFAIADPEIEADAESRLARLLSDARDLVQLGAADELALLFREPLAWPEPQRGYQAVRRLCQVVLDSSDDFRGQDWIELYAAAARGLADVLGCRTAEPVLLNAAGVFLHELTQHDAAIAIFERALSLDPSLPAVESNLAAAREAVAGRELMERPQDGETARRLCEVAAAARPVKGMTVSLCMIVKDEEEMLPGCLDAVASAVDEIIVVDTGSSDRTVEIAESFAATVLHFPWNGSFSDARNAGLDAATGDWLLYLDADEHLVPEDAPKIRELLGRTWREGFFLGFRNLTGSPEAGTAVVHPALRIFRNRPEYRFEGRIHEQVTRTMPTYLPERFELTAVRVVHLGYLDRHVAGRKKSSRNLALLEIEALEAPSPYVSFNLGGEYQRLRQWSAAARHFDQAWAALCDDDAWPSIGFAPMLALRTARARRECGRIEEAREVLEQALDRLPAYTDLMYELALCSIAAGDRNDAERLLERCIELGEAPPEFASTIGAGSHLASATLTQLRQTRTVHTLESRGKELAQPVDNCPVSDLGQHS